MPQEPKEWQKIAIRGIIFLLFAACVIAMLLLYEICYFRKIHNLHTDMEDEIIKEKALWSHIEKNIFNIVSQCKRLLAKNNALHIFNIKFYFHIKSIENSTQGWKT